VQVQVQVQVQVHARVGGCVCASGDGGEVNACRVRCGGGEVHHASRRARRRTATPRDRMILRDWHMAPPRDDLGQSMKNSSCCKARRVCIPQAFLVKCTFMFRNVPRRDRMARVQLYVWRTPGA
jgi:hypothetical protein